MPTPRGYRFALQWLIDNDDNEWIAEYAQKRLQHLTNKGEDAPTLTISVAASLVADIYGKTDALLYSDLTRRIQGRAADRERLKGNN